MAGTVEFSEEPDLAPSRNYSPDPAPQYPQPSYAFSRGSSNYGVDHDMSMVETYTRGLSGNMSAMAQSSNGHAQSRVLNVTPPNPGMAPPRTPQHQSFPSPPGQRGSLDGSQDMIIMHDGTRRKRSKVSRACDECRRKKVRCDATDDDGNIKTCSNCARAGQTCEYSRVPMKRGPSKGYIKELSERVQQVESQMAMSGGSSYRHSLESNLAMYSESSYSPDEVLSTKRNFSFSDNRGNPFAQPQFSDRERMPSTGGWSNTSGGGHFRPRDRYSSIAIAPDQVPDAMMVDGPSNVNINYNKPFWAQGDIMDRPSKRQRLSDDSETSTTDTDIGILARQTKLASDQVPIFPTADVDNLIKLMPKRLQRSLDLALSVLLPDPSSSNGHFHSYRSLEDYAWEHARISPDTREPAENLGWLWLYILMIILADQDIGRLHGASQTLSKSVLVKIAVDLAHHLKAKGIDGYLPAYNMTMFLARLHYFSTGVEEPPSISLLPHSIGSQNHDLSYLIRASELFPMITTTIQSGPLPLAIEVKSVKLIDQHLQIINNTTPSPDSRVEQTKARLSQLVNLLLARHYSSRHPSDILDQALQIVESICGTESQSNMSFKWNPLDLHLFTLSTITLVEFTDTIDTDLVDQAHKGLQKLHKRLEMITSQTMNEPGHGLEGYPIMRWTEALLKLIDRKSKSSPKEPNGISSSATSSNTTLPTNNDVSGPADDDQRMKNQPANPIATTGSTTTNGASQNDRSNKDSSPAATAPLPSASTSQSHPTSSPNPPTTAPTAPTTTAAAAAAPISLLVSRETDISNLGPVAASAPAPATASVSAPAPAPGPTPPQPPPPSGMRDKLLDPETGTVQLIDFRMLARIGWSNVLAAVSGF